MQYYIYNTKKYPFKEIIEKYLDLPLSDIKLQLDQVVTEYTDQDTEIHRKFYSIIDDSGFLKIYKSLVTNYVRPLYQEPLLYQTKPTFRVHLKNNLAVGNWHKDSDFGHSIYEDNFFVPITSAFGNNTIWIESKPNYGDFTPIEANYGDLVQFNGANLTHGNKLNDTNRTRVSFDFRIIRKKNYSPGGSSISSGRKFVLGDYWEELC